MSWSSMPQGGYDLVTWAVSDGMGVCDLFDVIRTK